MIIRKTIIIFALNAHLIYEKNIATQNEYIDKLRELLKDFDFEDD